MQSLDIFSHGIKAEGKFNGDITSHTVIRKPMYRILHTADVFRNRKQGFRNRRFVSDYYIISTNYREGGNRTLSLSL